MKDKAKKKLLKKWEKGINKLYDVECHETCACHDCWQVMLCGYASNLLVEIRRLQNDVNQNHCKIVDIRGRMKNKNG